MISTETVPTMCVCCVPPKHDFGGVGAKTMIHNVGKGLHLPPAVQKHRNYVDFSCHFLPVVGMSCKRVLSTKVIVIGLKRTCFIVIENV